MATGAGIAMGMEPAAAPEPAAARPTADRIAVLDALRGFALFGILLANIHYWSGWLFLQHPAKVALAGEAATEWEAFLQALLIDSKFYTLFSFLFGMGFALQLARLEARGADGVAIYRRRLLVLLAIGVTHMVLIWDGDILTIYALIGLLLPFFIRWSDRWLLMAAGALLLLPIPGYLAVRGLGFGQDLGTMKLAAAFNERFGISLGGEIAWLRREEWAAYWAWVLSSWPWRVVTVMVTWRIPKVLAIMLIGLWAGRKLADGRLIEDRRFLKKVALWGVAIGLPLNILYAMLGGIWGAQADDQFLAYAAHSLGVVPLALAYAASFVLIWPKVKSVARLLVAPGRMALTNYLMHSLLGILIFYGVGFGLVGTLPPAGFYAVAVVIFASQILFSHLWLARFGQGPMERLWRLGTYGRRAARPS